MPAERFPIEAGAIKLFARAVNDQNPIYHDPDHAAASPFGAVLAPPTFTVSAAQHDESYPLRPRPGVPWMGSGRNPTGLPRPSGSDGDGERKSATLHAEQHFTYHRPLLAGDVLTETVRAGDRWEKQGHAGRLVFSETISEFHDAAGNLVVTSRGVAVTPMPAESEVSS